MAINFSNKRGSGTGFSLAPGESLSTDIKSSDVIVPVDVQARYAKTIQLLTSQMVTPNGSTTTPWTDTHGYDKVAVSVKNNAATEASVVIEYSYDGINKHGADVNLSNSNFEKSLITDIKAPYFRVFIKNVDAAAPHTFTVYAYLKA